MRASGDQGECGYCRAGKSGRPWVERKVVQDREQWGCYEFIRSHRQIVGFIRGALSMFDVSLP